MRDGTNPKSSLPLGLILARYFSLLDPLIEVNSQPTTYEPLLISTIVLIAPSTFISGNETSSVPSELILAMRVLTLPHIIVKSPTTIYLPSRRDIIELI